MLGLLCAHAWGDVALSWAAGLCARPPRNQSMCRPGLGAVQYRLNARGRAWHRRRPAAPAWRRALRIHVTPDWDDASLAASKAGECQLLGFLNQSPDRASWIICAIGLNETSCLRTNIGGHQRSRVNDGRSVEASLQNDFPNRAQITEVHEQCAQEKCKT